MIQERAKGLVNAWSTAEALCREREKAIEKEVFANPEMPRLQQVPGIRFIGAFALVAFAENVRRFASGKKLVSYIGLNPSGAEAGEGIAPQDEPLRTERLEEHLRRGGPNRTAHGDSLVEVGETPAGEREALERRRMRPGAEAGSPVLARADGTPGSDAGAGKRDGEETGPACGTGRERGSEGSRVRLVGGVRCCNGGGTLRTPARTTGCRTAGKRRCKAGENKEGISYRLTNHIDVSPCEIPVEIHCALQADAQRGAVALAGDSDAGVSRKTELLLAN